MYIILEIFQDFHLLGDARADAFFKSKCPFVCPSIRKVYYFVSLLLFSILCIASKEEF